MWDPATYLRYGDERSRPFFDLLARVGAERPRKVVDLGCGPGNLTATLAERWPGARVRGIDSSPEMIDKAAAEAYPIGFEVGDLRDWSPEPDVDVVVSNAVLQWVPGHERLLSRWAAELPPGACLAVQVPGNFDAPSHRALREVAAASRRATLLGGVLREAPVLDPVGYAGLLADAGCTVDAWETTYVHQLPFVAGADHPVLTWMEGTALRPVRAALDADEWAVFRATLGARLAEEYPAHIPQPERLARPRRRVEECSQRGSVVSFPFRRVFFVART